MPELPEVETVKRALGRRVTGEVISAMLVRDRRLRWPIATGIEAAVTGQRIEGVGRRAKYLLLECTSGTLILHLGMSGSIRWHARWTPPQAHDHVDLTLANGSLLRYRDPRRFGSLFWTETHPETHWLLASLGPEPLGNTFDGAHLHRASRGRRVAVKNLIMDAHTVAGVGNIYASEALFLAGIHPARAAGRISRRRFDALASEIRTVLARSIASGGTTLRDYVQTDGSQGEFVARLSVYGRDGEPCIRCGGVIRKKTIGQRATYYCVRCQR